MYCSYHPSNAARVRCANCSRSLCPYCDHRIKGYPYCQDCIVLGIEALSHLGSTGSGSRHRPLRAFLCALLPGGGAVYNRQNFKAIVHFVAIMGLFQLSSIGVFEAFFALAGTAFYLYSLVDAFRTAEAIRGGQSAAELEGKLKQFLMKRASVLGLVLIVGGLLLLTQMILPAAFGLSLLKLTPVGLIFLGGYLIVSYLKHNREEDQPDYSAGRPLFPLEGQDEKYLSSARREAGGSRHNWGR